MKKRITNKALLMDAATCTLIFHNYYGDHESWVQLFSEKLHVPFFLCYNIVEDSIYNLDYDQQKMDLLRESASGPLLKKMILRRSPNRGKDIGGKLVLIDALLREEVQTDYLIFLHDKKSPHTVTGADWRASLFRVIEPGFVSSALGDFRTQPEVGIIAPAGNIRHEYDPSVASSYSGHKREQLEEVRKTFGIAGEDRRYVAGTMFWVRSAPLLTFFRQHSPLSIRKTLEAGNVLDQAAASYTHSWERLFSWLIFTQGYTIKGL